MRYKSIIITLIILLLIVNPLSAAELENYYLQTSFFTRHYNQIISHNNQQHLIGIERHYSNNNLDGIAFFKNSYDQQTFYIYKGTNYKLFSKGQIEITSKLTYGIIHGYDDENAKYTAWMNQVGTFPALVFSFGVRCKPFRLDMIPFGDAGILITGGVEF